MLLNFFNLISPTVLATLNFFNPISEPSEMFPHLYNFISEPSETFPHLCNYISEPSEMISHLYNFISEPSEMILNFFRVYSRKQKDTEPTCDPVSPFIFNMSAYLLFCKTSSTLPSASTNCISSAFAPAFTARTAFIDCRIFVSKSISGHAIIVVAACAIVSADASLLSSVTEVLKILQPAFPCSLFSFISNSMKGVFSDCTFSPFTSTTFHFPSSCLASVFEPEQAKRLPANAGTNKAYIKNFFISRSFY